MKIVFAGFRHGHILSLYRLAQAHGELEIAAAAEADSATRAELSANGKALITHDDIETMRKYSDDGEAIIQFSVLRSRSWRSGIQRLKSLSIHLPRLRTPDRTRPGNGKSAICHRRRIRRWHSFCDDACRTKWKGISNSMNEEFKHITFLYVPIQSNQGCVL